MSKINYNKLEANMYEVSNISSNPNKNIFAILLEMTSKNHEILGKIFEVLRLETSMPSKQFYDNLIKILESNECSEDKIKSIINFIVGGDSSKFKLVISLLKGHRISELFNLEIPINGHDFVVSEEIITKYFNFEAFKKANDHACKFGYARPYDVKGCLESGWIKKDGLYPLLAIISVNDDDIYGNEVRVLIGGENGRQLAFDMAFEHLDDLPEEYFILNPWRN